jgi:propionyl-CoA synthetase
VAECAVIGVPDTLKGQLPLALVVCKEGVEIDPDTLRAELVARVREELGALACFQLVQVVRRLPKTRSGKILRAVLRKMAAGEPCAPPATIDDPAILQELAPALRGALATAAP